MLDRHDTEGADCDLTPGMMPLLRAVVLAPEAVAPIADAEPVPLVGALGRIAAAAVAAPEAMPFFDNSAMDGFALRPADLPDTGILPVARTTPAGAAPSTLAPGAAMRIFTGAPLPAGADAVAMSENSTETDGAVRFDQVPKHGANIRRAGSDQPAANGVSTVAAVRRPRVGLFSTGGDLASYLPVEARAVRAWACGRKEVRDAA